MRQLCGEPIRTSCLDEQRGRVNGIQPGEVHHAERRVIERLDELGKQLVPHRQSERSTCPCPEHDGQFALPRRRDDLVKPFGSRSARDGKKSSAARMLEGCDAARVAGDDREVEAAGGAPVEVVADRPDQGRYHLAGATAQARPAHADQGHRHERTSAELADQPSGFNGLEGRRQSPDHRRDLVGGGPACDVERENRSGRSAVNPCESARRQERSLVMKLTGLASLVDANRPFPVVLDGAVGVGGDEVDVGIEQPEISLEREAVPVAAQAHGLDVAQIHVGHPAVTISSRLSLSPAIH